MRSFLFAGVLFAAACLFAFSLCAQQALPARPPDVIVTGSFVPLPFEESDRSVNGYSLQDAYLLFGSLADALDLDSSVQVQSRAPNGVQGDISIRGASYEQTLF